MRVIILLALVEWVAIGAALVLVAVSSSTDFPVSTQVTECSHIIASPLFAEESQSYDCAATTGSWAEASITTKYTTSLELAFKPYNGSLENIYNSTGSHFNALIPVFSGGIFYLRLVNLGTSGNAVTGSLSVSQNANSIAIVPSSKHPYRTGGIAVLGGAALISALVLYDPGKRLSRIIRAPGASV